MAHRHGLVATAAMLIVAACGPAPASPDAASRLPREVASSASTASPAASPPGPSGTPSPPVAAPSATTPDYPDGIVPARVVIPAIGVDAPLTDEPLGLVSSTEMEVPADPDRAGWFGLSRRPGEIGPAVIAGHVDSRTGPAVFYRLRDLSPGDRIAVADADGESLVFVVDELGRYPKDALPDRVFGFGEPRPELRLITCGGAFDRDTGHYRDNVVVYAHLADTGT